MKLLVISIGHEKHHLSVSAEENPYCAFQSILKLCVTPHDEVVVEDHGSKGVSMNSFRNLKSADSATSKYKITKSVCGRFGFKMTANSNKL